MSPAPTIRRAEATAILDRLDDLVERLGVLIADLDPPTTDTTEHHGDRPPDPR